MKVSALLGAVSLAIAGAEAALHGHGNHGSLARRLSGDMQNFDKRQTGNSRWSFYNTETGNAGSCGRHIKNSEFVVAMNMVEYNKERHCFKQIILEYGGKTATATIGDACPGCPWGALDLSTELFRYFAPLDKGIIYGSWRFADGGSPPPPPPPPPKPTSTWTPPPKPTSTWTPPKETWTPPPPPKPTSTWTPPKETWTPPKETYTPPKETPKETPKPEPTKTETEEEKPTTTSSTTPTSTPTSTPTNRVVANTPPAPKVIPNVEAVNNLAVMIGGLVVGGAYAA